VEPGGDLGVVVHLSAPDVLKVGADDRGEVLEVAAELVVESADARPVRFASAQETRGFEPGEAAELPEAGVPIADRPARIQPEVLLIVAGILPKQLVVVVATSIVLVATATE
jgi:hypothetical protein